MSLKQEPVPNHLAIIQDGNRRYALKRGHSAYRGHEEGVEATEKVLELCRETKINHLTVYAFSTENFKRDKQELNDLFSLFEEEFKKIPEDQRIHENNIRVRAIGRVDLLPENVRKAIKKAEESTKNYNDLYFNVAIAYGGQKELTDSIKENLKHSKKKKNELNLKDIEKNLYPHHLNEEPLPDVDLLIRTGKEKRISNFLLWRTRDSVIYFSNKYWPEFDEKEFKKALNRYKEVSNR